MISIAFVASVVKVALARVVDVVGVCSKGRPGRRFGGDTPIHARVADGRGKAQRAAATGGDG